MIKPNKRCNELALGTTFLIVLLGTACSSDQESTSSAGTDGETSTADPAGTGEDNTTNSTVAFWCEEIASRFVTKGPANADLPDPEVSATCLDDEVVITSNQIPDFPYVGTTPGIPRVFDLEFSITTTPTLADSVTEVPPIGAIGVAVNGIPIYGATEGAGGDVLAMPNFVECGGHNGPGGYHYHTFNVVGSDACLFSAADVEAGPVLFGLAFDGYPIYSGNNLYTSSWYLEDGTAESSDGGGTDAGLAR